MSESMFPSLQWQTSSAPSMKKLSQLCIPIFRCRCCEGHSVKRITISQQCHHTPTPTSKHRRCAPSQIFQREHQFCLRGKSRRTWTFSDSYTSVTHHSSNQSFTQERAWNLNIYCNKHLFLQHKRAIPVSLLSHTHFNLPSPICYTPQTKTQPCCTSWDKTATSRCKEKCMRYLQFFSFWSVFQYLYSFNHTL